LKTIPNNQELRAVRDLIAFIVMTLKNYSLYPENHNLFKKLITDLFERFEIVFNSSKSIEFEIDKNRVLYKEEIVYQKTDEEDNFAFFLFRDGIRRIEFLKSLNKSEINDFISILKSFSTENEDPEGDLVTALWEAHFKNIRYKAIDIYWDSELLTDLNKFSVKDPKLINEIFDNHMPENSSVPATISTSKNRLFKLDDTDISKLRNMIVEEENREIVKDLFSLISVVIKDKRNACDTESLLLFIKTELRKTLFQGNLKFGFLILSGLHKLRLYAKEVNPESVGTIGQCIKSISEPSFLNGFHKPLRIFEVPDQHKVELLKDFLLLLDPIAIYTIVPLLSKIQFINFQIKLIEIIQLLSNKDSQPIETLLVNSDEPTILKLLYVVERLAEDKSKRILLKIIKNPSAKVRAQALKYLLHKNSVPIDIIFPYIDDPDQTVRQVTLEYLQQNRTDNIEDQLCEYLELKRKSRNDPNHILKCYKTLGICGSARSIPFLKTILSKNRVLPNPLASTHQKGAVIALCEIKTNEAHKILEKVSHSFFPKIRKAYRQAMCASNG
jgi:hypothetical protein